MRSRPVLPRLLVGGALVLAARTATAQGGVGVALGAVAPVARQQPSVVAGEDRLANAEDEVPLAVLVLAHRVALGLTAPQLAQVGALAAHLDSVLPPLDAEIGALRVRATVDDWRLVDATRAAALREQARRRGALVAARHDARQEARTATLALLTAPQRDSALAIEAATRRSADDRLRRTRGGGWGAFGGARADSTGTR
ncbi:hypothetical protein [Roseisolibacter agri]|uniref:Uncharacterized protein n=1 Tax=Roseisolibacter agri TaxID=2014610 RepID=A0AA37Q516_9BACT|nr:hypothetical protein [Roseisolibacter agri]GLC23897.1 hypothetical protein rosag_04100 [Roseisolibacter agri]